jgi:lipoprotein-releasing system permease protein
MKSVIWFLFRRLALDPGQRLSRLVVGLAKAGVAVGILVMLTAIAIVNGFQQTIPDKFTGFWGHIQIQKLDLSNSFEQQRFGIRKNLLDSIKKHESVLSATPYATKGGILKTDESFEGVVLKGVDESWDSTFIAESLVSGRMPNFSSIEPSNELLMPQKVADKLYLKVGDRVQLYFIQDPPRVRSLKIVGIYKLGIEGEFARPFVIADLRHIQRLNNWESHDAGAIEVHLKSTHEIEATTAALSAMVDNDLEAYSIQELYPNLFSWLGLFDLNKQVLIVIMLLVAGVNMISALLILILERTHTIGLLKTMGMLSRDIRKLFLLTGTYIALWGMFWGNLIGLGFYFLQRAFRFIPLDEASYYVSYVPMELSISEVMLLNAGTLAACLLMLLGPSFLITRISPLKAIRFD